MNLFVSSRRGALAAGTAVVALAGCAKDPELVLAPKPSASINAAFMERYAAVGNSISAGFQSGGIGVATQSVAFPALVARAAGVRYAAAYLTGPGCAPLTDPVSAFRGAAMDPTVRTSNVCVRTPESMTLLTNVSVPGASTATVTSPTVASNPLYTLMLGGRTEVQRALELDPTFVSVWIGNNDVLFNAINGDTTGITPLATFQANYDKMIGELTAGAASRKGILIGVVDVANVPVLFPITSLMNNTNGIRTFVETAFLGGRPLLFVNCPTTTTSRTSIGYFLVAAASVAQLPPGTPVPFACSPTPVGPGVTLGAAGVLDANEAAMVSARVAAYNAYIQQKANSIGWAYWDPNTLLSAARAQGGVLATPVLTGPQAATAPYGTITSLDGIHPSTAAHVAVANAIITVINQKYGSSIPAVTGP